MLVNKNIAKLITELKGEFRFEILQLNGESCVFIVYYDDSISIYRYSEEEKKLVLGDIL